MATTEQRLGRLEGAYEQVDARLNGLNNRLNEMNGRINTMIALLGAAWISIMLAIIGLYFAN